MTHYASTQAHPQVHAHALADVKRLLGSEMHRPAKHTCTSTGACTRFGQCQRGKGCWGATMPMNLEDRQAGCSGMCICLSVHLCMHVRMRLHVCM